MSLPMLPQDKANHVIYGLVAFIVGNTLHSWQAGMLAATAVAVGKELYDKLSGKGVPDGWDVVATLGGAVLGKLSQYESTFIWPN